MSWKIGLEKEIVTLVVVSENTIYDLDRGENDWPTRMEMDALANVLYEEYGPLADVGFLGMADINGHIEAYAAPKFIVKVAEVFGLKFRMISCYG